MVRVPVLNGKPPTFDDTMLVKAGARESILVGDNYGDVSIKAKKLVIDKMPRFELESDPI